MSTGAFENWTGEITEIGAIYPFVGWEGFMVIVGLVTWIGWHVIQTRRENADYEEQKKRFTKERLARIVGAEDPENP